MNRESVSSLQVPGILILNLDIRQNKFGPNNGIAGRTIVCGVLRN